MSISMMALRSRLAVTISAAPRPVAATLAVTVPAAATFAATVMLSVLLAGCSVMDGSGEDSGPAGAASSVVDSILPAEVELERFQADLPRPDSLAAGAPSREDLVRRFADALEAGDTLALDELVLTRAEFAYLYYPTSQYTREPYRMNPALLWFIMDESGHKGSRRALRRFGGSDFGYAGHRCDPEPKREGENLLWTGCMLIRARPDEADFLGEENAAADAGERASGTPGIRLFGTIIEHRGHFKFISFANPL